MNGTYQVMKGADFAEELEKLRKLLQENKEKMAAIKGGKKQMRHFANIGVLYAIHTVLKRRT